MRARSRHGTNVTDAWGPLLANFWRRSRRLRFHRRARGHQRARDGRPAQDFTTVTRAVVTGGPAATERLSFVGFDGPALGGRGCAGLPLARARWPPEPSHAPPSAIGSGPSPAATPAAHSAIVALALRPRCSSARLELSGRSQRPLQHPRQAAVCPSRRRPHGSRSCRTIPRRPLVRAMERKPTRRPEGAIHPLIGPARRCRTGCIASEGWRARPAGQLGAVIDGNPRVEHPPGLHRAPRRGPARRRPLNFGTFAGLRERDRRPRIILS